MAKHRKKRRYTRKDALSINPEVSILDILRDGNGMLIKLTQLRKKSGLQVSEFNKTYRDLLERGDITTKRGPQGGVWLTESFVDQHESKLIPGLLAALQVWAEEEQNWIAEGDDSNCVVANTSSAGPNDTGGTWTRPDIMMIAVQSYVNMPSKYIEVLTFELKKMPKGNKRPWDIQSVHEALAHSKGATESYVVLEGKRIELEKIDKELLERVETECVRFGIGLMFFEKKYKNGSVSVQIRPKRSNPHPYDMNELISNSFQTKKLQEKLKKIQAMLPLRAK